VLPGTWILQVVEILFEQLADKVREEVRTPRGGGRQRDACRYSSALVFRPR
jgi:hypothetical protein